MGLFVQSAYVRLLMWVPEHACLRVSVLSVRVFVGMKTGHCECEAVEQEREGQDNQFCMVIEMFRARHELPVAELVSLHLLCLVLSAPSHWRHHLLLLGHLLPSLPFHSAASHLACRGLQHGRHA